MAVEIVFGVNLATENQTTVTDDEIQRLNPVLTHTGKGDLTATLKGNRDLEQYAQRQDRINVNVNGSTKWTGYLIMSLTTRELVALGFVRMGLGSVSRRLGQTMTLSVVRLRIRTRRCMMQFEIIGSH